MANKEMKTLAFGNVTYEVVDEKARRDLEYKIPNSEKGKANGVASLDKTGKVPKEQLPEPDGDANVQSDWNESTETSDAFIKNKPSVKAGTGEDSLVIGDGDAQGKNSAAAGGSNDSDEIDKVKRMAQLAGYTVDTDNPTAYGDGSLALGVGAKSHSMGSLAIGISNSAGAKGFYWHSIDWSGTHPIIQLSTEQKPYYYYKIPVVGTKVPVNETATWNTEAANLLANWSVGDVLTIVNNIKYGGKVVIETIDSTNGKITVQSLPFYKHDVKVKYASLSDIKSLVWAFDDYSIYNTSKVASGTVEFAYGALSLGSMTNAAGSFSQALGYDTKVVTDFGHAEGRETVADYAAHAEGYLTKALGRCSHAEGSGTTASGINSHSEGYSTKAKGQHSHAEGSETQAIGFVSHAEGYSEAKGDYSHSEGYSTKAKGQHSHAEGSETQAIRSFSHAQGKGSIAEGMASSAEGNWTVAKGDFSHAEGSGTTASGINSHSEGKGSIASDENSHAEGYNTKASGVNSHAEGSETQASSLNSHAEGCNTKASGVNSHAEGIGTIARSAASHVQGKWNEDDTENKYAHILGNGTSTVPLNLHTIRWEDGQGFFKGGTTTEGADYAEFFEWLDGNLDNEDRVGLLVTLDGEKIRLANAGDEVLGIISGTAAVLGDNYECEWNGKYLTDDFGRIIYDLVEEFIDVEHIEFKEVEKEIIDEETQETRIEIELEEVKTKEKKSLGFWKHPRLNPNYDPEQVYVNRSDRPEWEVVGMLGKLYVRDDGTCEVNEYVTVGEKGIATASTEKTNMRVLSRVNENVIRVLLK